MLEDEWEKAKALIAEYADYFVLSVREVLPIPEVEHCRHH